jgi:hypothetical protein
VIIFFDQPGHTDLSPLLLTPPPLTADDEKLVAGARLLERVLRLALDRRLRDRHSCHVRRHFLKRLPGVGSEPGSSQFHLLYHCHHFTAEPQRLPSKAPVTLNEAI